MQPDAFSHTRTRAPAPEWVARAVVVCFVLAIVALWRADLHGSYESAGLLIVLNTVFTTFVSGFIAVLAARTFLARGEPGSLSLGTAMMVWGAAAFVATAGGHVGNYNITIHNLGVAVSALCHLTAAIFLAGKGRTLRQTGAWLACAYVLALTVVGLIWLGTLEGWWPKFFIDGSGGTPVRGVVLGSSTVMMLVAAGLMAIRSRTTVSRFPAWYSLGLTLVSAGAVGLMFQTIHGGVVGWTARTAQYLGGVYLFIGAVLAVRETRLWELPLEMALEEVRDRYELLSNTVPALIFYLDRERRYQSCNQAFQKWFGVAREEVVGQAARAFHGEAAWRIVEPRIDRAFSGEAVEFEAEVPYRLGGSRWVHAIYTPHRDSKGQVAGLVAMVNDVTARQETERRLRESEERVRMAARAAGFGIHDYDVEKDSFIWTAEMYAVTGVPLGTPIRTDLVQSLIHPEDRDWVVARMRAALDPVGSGSFSEEFRILRKDTGETRWVHHRSQTIFEETAGQRRPVRNTGVVFDIHERKMAETAVREAMERAEQASRAKDDFLAALSHELRTPLTPVLLSAEVMAKDSTLPPAAQAAFAGIRRNVELEARLIDDLLDLTRITRGKLVIRPALTDVHAALAQAEEISRDDARAMDIHIECQRNAQEHFANADEVRLEQVFWNLLKNAIKFTPFGGKIRVSTSNPRPGRLQVRVEDNGIGIAPEALQTIFRPFDQGHLGHRHQFGGLGLGLAISKAIVEQHGGLLKAESEGLGKGAAFTVELSTVAAPADSDPTKHAALGSVSPLRLLVVEDHNATRSTLKRLLEREGHRVSVAASVAEADQFAESHDCDLLICDLGLPDGSGLDLMARLGRARGWPGIALSGYGMDTDLQNSREAGFAEHLVKPVDLTQLREAIARVVSKRT